MAKILMGLDAATYSYLHLLKADNEYSIHIILNAIVQFHRKLRLWNIRLLSQGNIGIQNQTLSEIENESRSGNPEFIENQKKINRLTETGQLHYVKVELDGVYALNYLNSIMSNSIKDLSKNNVTLKDFNSRYIIGDPELQEKIGIYLQKSRGINIDATGEPFYSINAVQSDYEIIIDQCCVDGMFYNIGFRTLLIRFAESLSKIRQFEGREITSHELSIAYANKVLI